MHILCTICSDLINQAENINVTKCGHIFHFHCLSEWIGRSKTCPQCRNKVTEKSMHRIFPTISEVSQDGDDATTLQAKLDDTLLQLREQRKKENELNTILNSTTERLKQALDALNTHEKQLVCQESAITALKKQLEYVKIQNKETNQLRAEKQEFETKLNLLTHIQRALESSTEEVELMMSGCSELRTVVTMATALKKALCESENKKKELRKMLQDQTSQLQKEKENYVKVVEKNVTLREKLKNLQLINKQKNLDGSPSSSRKLQPSIESPSWSETVPQVQDVELNNTSVSSLAERAESSSSPYLQLRQSSLALAALQQRWNPQSFPLHGIKPMEFGILKCRAKVEPPKISNECTKEGANYDGLGGRRAWSPPLRAPRPPAAPLRRRPHLQHPSVASMLLKRPRLT